MFNLTTLNEYSNLYNQFLNEKYLCLLFVILGFIGIIVFIFLGKICSKDEKINILSYIFYFCVIISLGIEIYACIGMGIIENNIGQLNNEWKQYQITIEKQEKIKK